MKQEYFKLVEAKGEEVPSVMKAKPPIHSKEYKDEKVKEMRSKEQERLRKIEDQRIKDQEIWVQEEAKEQRASEIY